MRFNTCPHCGSNLDPGEQCDCMSEIETLQMPQKDEDAENETA